ncbi:MAG TPA: hypothetical protein VHU87_10665 [Rhizomicrobium sp.]|jgi:Arc/MetJ-type ribon-helix-helix transcriptional regulator|nr:hypothetical protein [Rhizomicrobium sp.]
MAMRVTLSKKSKSIIARLVANGRFSSRNELLKEGVRLLVARDKLLEKVGAQKRKARKKR